MTNKSLAAAAAALLMLTGIATEAAAAPTGRWQCRHANQTVSNNGFENWIYEFALALNANGSFQAQGNYLAQTNGFAIPFAAQGRWEQQQGSLVAQGVEQRQDGMGGQFFLLFSIVGDESMSNQYQSANGKLLTYCQR